MCKIEKYEILQPIKYPLTWIIIIFENFEESKFA